MKVTMAEINKEASSIVNQVSSTGESAVIYKHGRPVVEIRALSDVHTDRKNTAYRNLLRSRPVKVSEPIDQVIEKGRKRGVQNVTAE